MPGIEFNSDGERVHRFFSGTGPSYDRIVNIFTFGFDIWWKQKILESIPSDSAQIIDHACGTGILTFKIAKRFPSARVVGIELREEYLDIAKQKSKALSLNNVEFMLGRAEDILLDGCFDCITSSYLAKYAQFEALIENSREMLRNEGVFIMHDFTYPSGRAFARLWEFYFRLLQTLGSRKYPQWKTVFFELPLLLRETQWVTRLLRSLKENAFSDITSRYLTFGTSNIVTARKR